MAKKQYFLIVDTETTIDNQVADFGAIIVDRKGTIIKQCACMVHGVFGTSDLFYDKNADSVFSKESLIRRTENYNKMLAEGTRMLASVRAINKWLEQAREIYNPIVTAYNLAFDLSKCQNTGINLMQFDKSFCLWSAAFTAYAHTKKFRQMVLDTHSFNAVTKAGNMTYQTNAEIMTRFVLNNPSLPDEPHTALEDVIYYELPILKKLLKNHTTHFLLNECDSYNWREVQVKDWFRPL